MILTFLLLQIGISQDVSRRPAVTKTGLLALPMVVSKLSFFLYWQFLWRRKLPQKAWANQVFAQEPDRHNFIVFPRELGNCRLFDNSVTCFPKGKIFWQCLLTVRWAVWNWMSHSNSVSATNSYGTKRENSWQQKRALLAKLIFYIGRKFKLGSQV